MSEPLIIEATKLSKRYGQTEVLRELDLSVRAGSVFALLGRNGAGKTSLIKTLLNMVRPSGGQAFVFGLPVDELTSSIQIRQRTGFVSEEKDLLDAMTVAELIRFTAAFYPNWNHDAEQHFLDSFDLPAERKVKQLSKGMRTRLAIMLALSRNAELLILDEPTSGLDPAAAEETLRAIVRHVANAQVTVLFSSHQISEVEQIADHVAIIEQGKVLLQGDIEVVRAQHCRVQLVFNEAAPQLTLKSPGIDHMTRDGRLITLVCSSDTEQLLAEVRQLGAQSVDVTPMTLKDIFLSKVGNHD